MASRQEKVERFSKLLDEVFRAYSEEVRDDPESLPNLPEHQPEIPAAPATPDQTPVMVEFHDVPVGHYVTDRGEVRKK